MRAPAAAIVAYCLLTLVPDAAAICVGPYPPCKRYWEADVVFVGTVSRITCGSAPRDEAEPHLPTDEVHLTVDEAFRGVSDSTIAVREWRCHGAWASHSVEFEPGKQYFVYAHRNVNSGALTTSDCTTQPLSEAQDSLDYARWIRTSPAHGRVFGTIAHHQWDPIANTEVIHPIPAGLLVRLTGPSGTHETAIQGDGVHGQFEFDGVTPGTYDIEVDVNGPYVVRQESSFGSRTAGWDADVRAPEMCDQVSIALAWKGAIRGRVVDSAGRTVPRIPITVVARAFAAAPPDTFRWQERIETDDAGEFAHSHLAPGAYVLGIHIDRNAADGPQPPAFYFPGVPDVASSRPVVVTLGSETDLGDFRLPVAVDKVPVEGLVVRPDGAPAPGMRLSLTSEQRTFEPEDLAVISDANGRFLAYVVRGRRYSVSAYGQDGDEQLAGNAVILGGDEAPPLIRLRVVRP